MSSRIATALQHFREKLLQPRMFGVVEDLSGGSGDRETAELTASSTRTGSVWLERIYVQAKRYGKESNAYRRTSSPYRWGRAADVRYTRQAFNEVTSLTAGSRQLLVTPRRREGPVRPGGCCVRRVRLPGRCDRSVGRRSPLG